MINFQKNRIIIAPRTHYFASPKYKNALSFLVGYSNTLGLVGGLCSIDYGFALMFCSVWVEVVKKLF